MPRWLQTVLARIREDARAGRVRFTHKALRELTALELGLDLDDCCDVLDKLGASDFAGRVKSLITSEWMYVFKPMVTGTRLHLKLILRRECIIISSTRRTTTMVTRAQPRSKVRRKGFGTRFPDDACPKCGTIMRERRATLRLPVNGEEVAVPDSAHLRCPKCGEVVLRMDEARKLRERALQAYRSRYDLLSADEIRSIRERHHLTQAQLARLLRLGGNTISRWESGRNVQTAAMDVLLRLIRDIPESLRYLKRHAA